MRVKVTVTTYLDWPSKQAIIDAILDDPSLLTNNAEWEIEVVGE